MQYIDRASPALNCRCSFTATPDSNGVFVVGRIEDQESNPSLLANQTETFEDRFRYNRYMWRTLKGDLIDAAEQLRGGIHLDVGCGEGNYGVLFENMYEAYVGLEPSDLPVTRRVPEQLRGNPRAFVVQYDPREPLPIQPNAVDVAWLIGSYDHIPNDQRQALVRQIHACLKPGGICVITMTNEDFWLKRMLRACGLGRLIPRESDHHCVHSPATLLDELNRAGSHWDVRGISADAFFVPNVPVLKKTIYQTPLFLKLFNGALRFLFLRILHFCHPGSYMIVCVAKKRRPEAWSVTFPGSDAMISS